MPPTYQKWWVYVLQSEEPRTGKRGNPLPGFHYVGSTTAPARRLRQHNGEIKGGGRYTSQHRPWRLRSLHGPYANRSEAFKAEMALKRGKRGVARTQWKPSDSKWCRGLGADDPRIPEINAACTSGPAATPGLPGTPPAKGPPDD